MTNPVGNPTKYTKSTIDKVNNYIENYKEHGHIIPSVVGLAGVIGVTSRTIQKWANDKSKHELIRTLERLEDKQHECLLSGGLSSEFNSTITKLALHNHGYSEKTESKIDIGELPSLDDYYN